jgi:hypothetical protein
VLVLGIIGSYIFGFAIGLQIMTTLSPQGISPPEFVNIHLIIQSNHPMHPLNYSDSSVIPSNRTLIDHLNRTIGPNNWSGQYYENGGWFIREIFNVSEQGGWYWLISYRLAGVAGWEPSLVGASIFQLNQDYDIRFLFQDG